MLKFVEHTATWSWDLRASLYNTFLIDRPTDRSIRRFVTPIDLADRSGIVTRVVAFCHAAVHCRELSICEISSLLCVSSFNITNTIDSLYWLNAKYRNNYDTFPTYKPKFGSGTWCVKGSRFVYFPGIGHKFFTLFGCSGHTHKRERKRKAEIK